MQIPSPPSVIKLLIKFKVHVSANNLKSIHKSFIRQCKCNLSSQEKLISAIHIEFTDSNKDIVKSSYVLTALVRVYAYHSENLKSLFDIWNKSVIGYLKSKCQADITNYSNYSKKLAKWNRVKVACSK